MNGGKTMKMKKETLYILTGGAGFMGSLICRELLERGEKVRTLVLTGNPAIEYIPSGAEIVEGDICDAASLDRLFAVPEGTETIVIHSAAIVSMTPEFDQKIMDVNVGGTQNIISQCLKHSECKKLVYVSSSGAIPEPPKGTKITETDHFLPIDEKRQVGCYCQSKAIATQYVLNACRDNGLNACVVHPTGIMGPGDEAICETTATLIKIMNGEMRIGIEGSFHLADARDLAHGCVAAADRGRSGECYILGNEEITFQEMYELLHDASGCRKPMFYVPPAAAYHLVSGMERELADNGKKPMITDFAVYNLERNNDFDSSKAKRELGYHTRPYAETLHDEAEWLVAKGYVKNTNFEHGMKVTHA